MNVLFLQRPHVGMRAFDAIERAVEVERPFARPGELHQFEIFGGAAVALRLRREIAVAFLLVVGLAGAERDDDAFHGFFLGGIRNDDAALFDFLLFDSFHEETVAEGFNV